MDVKDLLNRTTLRIPLERYLSVLQQEFHQIRLIQEYQPILEGYEDVNIILNTDSGKYALKIFAKFRSEKNILNYIKIIHEASKIGVQTLELVQSQTGKDYFFYENTYSILTKYFEGENFVETPPTLEEILLVTTNIARLNTLDFDVDATYDSWGSNNLLNEYSNTIVKNEEVKKEILPIINFLEEFDTYKFSRGVIHGDMQRKHVLKNSTKLCIIDYGCMRNDLKVYDLSIFLAWFCLGEENWEEKDKILESVIKEYIKINALSNREIESLIPLITASYAAYYLKTQELIEQGDRSKETLDWNSSARNLYRRSLNWSNLK
jgi:Ser/Thr protein kinase RdoA (MazF antagonist)